MYLLVKRFLGFFLSKSVFRYFKTKKKNKKKVPMATKLEGEGVKALVAGPLKKNNFFCGFNY